MEQMLNVLTIKQNFETEQTEQGTSTSVYEYKSKPLSLCLLILFREGGIKILCRNSRSGGGGGSSSGRGGASRESSSSTQERPSEFSRWRERQYFGPRRWLESALRDTSWDKDGGNNDGGKCSMVFL